MIKLVIFDLGDTLFQTKDSYKYILSEIVEEKWNIKKDITVEAFDKTLSEMQKFDDYTSTEDFYKEFNSKLLKKLINSPLEKQEQEFKEIINQMKEIAPVKQKTYPYVKETLKYLREKGYNISVLTGKKEKKLKSSEDKNYKKSRRETLEKMFSNSGIDKYVDKLFITYEHSTVKPRPEAFQLPLNYFNVDPEEAVMIGDREEDLAASKLGIHSILFDPSGNYDGKIKPEYRIKSFSELLEIIKSVENKD